MGSPAAQKALEHRLEAHRHRPGILSMCLYRAGSQDSLDGAPGDVPASISTAEAQLGVAAQPQRMAALCSSHAQLLPRLAVLGDLRLSVTAHNPELLSEGVQHTLLLTSGWCDACGLRHSAAMMLRCCGAQPDTCHRAASAS